MAANATGFSQAIQGDLSGISLWYTGIAVVGSLLVLEQVIYRSKKQHLPGPRWTIPLIGQFLDSRYPSMEKYIQGWSQGPLTAVSVFNMFVVIVLRARSVHGI